MNRVDKAALRIIIPVLVSVVTAYYTVIHFDKINFIIQTICTEIQNDLTRLF